MATRTWIVTGASSGFGRVIARSALEQGDQVVGTARDAERLVELAEAWPETFLPVAFESTSEADQEALVSAALERFGRIDVLVNNAGVGHHGAIEDSDWEGIRRVFEVDFFAPVGLIREALPVMRAQGAGLIVNVSSMGVHLNAASGNAFYCAAKMALERLSETLRNEAEPYGVKVMVVSPGSFATGFRAAAMHDLAKEGDVESATARALAQNGGLAVFGKQGDPEDAGKAIVWAACQAEPPRMLVLGKGMADAARAAQQRRIDEIVGAAE